MANIWKITALDKSPKTITLTDGWCEVIEVDRHEVLLAWVVHVVEEQVVYTFWRLPVALAVQRHAGRCVERSYQIGIDGGLQEELRAPHHRAQATCLEMCGGTLWL